MGLLSEQGARGTILEYHDLPVKRASTPVTQTELLYIDHVAYWRREFATIPEPLPLNRARVTSRRPFTCFSANTANVHLRPAVAQQVQRLARDNTTTPFHVYLASFRVLLHRLTGVEDVAIGIKVTGQDRHNSLSEADGDTYPSIVPLRFTHSSQSTFGDILDDTRRRSGIAISHSRVPVDVLVDELQLNDPDPLATHNPIFQALLDYREGTAEQWKPGADMSTSKYMYDLSLDITDDSQSQGGGVFVTLRGHESLYSLDDVRIFANMFEDIVGELVNLPLSKSISKNWQYRQSDLDRALEVGKGQLQEREWPETLIERFLDISLQFDGKTALIHPDGTTLTYGQMRQRLDTIAATLVERGVELGDSVGVHQESTPDWICSMLAIWKVGGVYLPLDPGTKVERLAMVVGDCKPTVILVDGVTKNKSKGLAITASVFVDVSTIETVALAGAANDPITTGVRATPEGLAMVYYTSGSTGNPKGIAIKHEGLRAVFQGSCKNYGVDESTVTLVQSSLAFDMCLIQMFISWPVGGTVCMISRDMRGDSVSLVEYMANHRVTHTAGTPSEYNSWLRYGDRSLLRSSAWRAALCGAEAFPLSLLDNLRELGKADFRLFHIYGTTETTVYATQQELNWKDEGIYTEGMVPAGYSLPNKTMYIVDENMHLLPIGLPGEIVLGGVGVARGYNNESMTKRSFVPNVFASEDLAKRGWTTMYRTKDRGQLLSDGSVLVEGRIGDDTEIKLRGQRIDLKDIEQTIIRCARGSVVEAVVSVRSTAGTDTQFLVGHVVLSPNKTVWEDEQKFLHGLPTALPLPQYMVPTVLVSIEKMPVSISGKLDRKAVASLPVTLPESGTTIKTVEEVGWSEGESKLRTVWEEILPQGMFDITPESDFFHVGGTSLLLVELQSRIRKQLGASIRLIQLFSTSVLRSMAGLITPRDVSITPNAPVIQASMPTVDWEYETRPLPLSPTLPVSPSAFATPHHKPKSILITGSTGFLGRALIRAAIKNPVIEHIHAVAVRNLSRRHSDNTPIQHPKVTYYPGDLCAPNLGLPSNAHTNLLHTIDAIIHNGADVNHLKSYTTLRRANVDSTKELVRLCQRSSSISPTQRHAPIAFHYVSTVGVGTFLATATPATPSDVNTQCFSFGEESAQHTPPPVDGSNGYNAGKWASERFLERTVEDATRLGGDGRLGHVWIHRPSDMVRFEEPSDTAANKSDGGAGGNGCDQDILHSLMTYCRKLRAVPAVSDNFRGWLDMIAVGRVATELVQMVVEGNPRVPDGDGVSYVHHTGDIAIPMDKLKEFFEEECGHAHAFERVPMGEWARRARSAGMKDAVAAVFEAVDVASGAMGFPRFVKTWRPVVGGGRGGGMLLVRSCRRCGESLEPVWGQECPGCRTTPVMPVRWDLNDDGVGI